MTIITILRIIVCLQCWHEGTIKRLRPSVGLCWGWEQKQNPSIPNRIRRDHESFLINTRRPNHNEVQSVTAIKQFCRERVAVNPFHSIVLCVFKHQTIVRSRMTLAPSWFRQFQCCRQGIYLQNDYNDLKNLNDSKQNKRNISVFFLMHDYCCQRNLNTGQRELQSRS